MLDLRSDSSYFAFVDNKPNGTARVLRCASLIPVGYVTTYGAIAKVVGGSPRAVGQALASNPFPLLIPCHRVVRADFSIGGFGGCGGVETKRELLRGKDRGYEKSTERRVGNKVLSLFPVNLVLHAKDGVYQ